ncbi:multidrug effflux MFS transporter [Pseudomonas sp. NPDC089428]|uniref:multidrug effflux MFS transporter n=1 Tax=Pseudomonas TaxID=286 RepID=UPI002189AE5A|nr:multidrug effflux MFS transporter [Pseudomonas sp. LRP2-20]BDM21311.1 multidrug effflux MFS transporter [Pseudomonas sp. LRP2-20]
MKAIDPHARAFLILLASVSALGALAIDMALPANGSTALALGIAPEAMAWSLSVFLAGFAAAPLLAGPLSDRFGRKPVLLASLALFSVASIGCALSDSLGTLLAWRLLQGIGGGAGRPVILAVMRDCFQGSQARSKLSFMAALGMLAPLLAPGLGAVLIGIASWQMLYVLLAVYGIGIGLLFARGFQETLASPLLQFSPRSLVSGYMMALREPQFLAGTLVTSASFASIFAYVGAAPSLFIDDLGLSPDQFGLTFGACSAGLIVGAVSNGRLSARHVEAHTLLLAGAGLAVAGCAGLAVCAVADARSVWPWLASIIALTMSGGLVSGNATQLALQPFRQHAGSASALMSALQMGGASLAGALVAAVASIGAGPSMVMVCAACQVFMLGGIVWLRAQARHGLAASATAESGH